MFGKSKEDRQFEKDIKHKFRDGTANARLRRMVRGRTKDSECFWCLKWDETFPACVWACDACVKRILKNNSVHIEEVRNFMCKSPCELCGEPKTHQQKVYVRLCEKCLNKFGKMQKGVDYRHANRKYQGQVQRFARRVA